MAKSGSFSIDDAFQESEEDKIRLYDQEAIPLQVMREEEEEVSHTTVTVQSPDEIFLEEDRIKIIKKPILIPPKIKGIMSRDDNTSQDSNSLIQGQSNGYYTGPAQEEYWFNHPKVKQNQKMVIAAIVLVILGACLIITSIVIYSIPSLESVQGFIFLIAGIICLLPGGYHLIYIYLAVKGKRGFDFSHLPLFN
eukprot:TRINITY_DN9507_c0_g1_i2.p1 TRINITY_DN9507_c0_g1~~TRINITY_DN9507_c0_g1_i2.p1  ORF type:complete len:194 (-),score=38.42 TRINITY_DN9507_c0_g1_i2:127-708(-)